MTSVKRVVGVLELASKYRYGLTSRGYPLYLFRPYDEALPDFIVGCSERNTTTNQIALVDIPVPIPTPVAPEKPRATLFQLVGQVGDSLAERRALLEHYCPVHQSTKSATAPIEVDSSRDSERQEISAATGWTVFHVDPPGCRDIDDAIAYHAERDTWAITIADVAAVVAEDSLVDQIAQAMGATFYDLDGRVQRSMLPPAISEAAGSLLPGQRRRGLTLFCEPGERETWGLTWITVEHSFTYESFAASELAKHLHVGDREPHAWIESWMVMYNASAGDLFARAGAGILRVQSPADAAAKENWAAIDPALVFFAHEAARYEAASEEGASQHQGHAGLGVSAYAHVSSPLRRYVDLVNQRILKSLIREDVHVVSEHDAVLPNWLNERNRANRRWARDLTFLRHVVPGRVQTVDVIWVDGNRVWVPAWQRLLKPRHDPVPPVPGTRDRFQIFCDPTQRNWKRRVRTAPVSLAS